MRRHLASWERRGGASSSCVGGESSPRLSARGRGRGAASSFPVRTRARRHLVFPHGDEGAASSSREATRSASFACWKTRRRLLFRLRDEAPPRLPTQGRGSDSFSCWKTRRHLVFQLGAAPRLPEDKARR
ncbi:hypothetical protein GW17_00026563 [Ensete ventricosum]|nr:hypothetical protein GW17_00026563 [Ensete ventricosum]